MVSEPRVLIRKRQPGTERAHVEHYELKKVRWRVTLHRLKIESNVAWRLASCVVEPHPYWKALARWTCFSQPLVNPAARQTARHTVEAGWLPCTACDKLGEGLIAEGGCEPQVGAGHARRRRPPFHKARSMAASARFACDRRAKWSYITVAAPLRHRMSETSKVQAPSAAFAQNAAAAQCACTFSFMQSSYTHTSSPRGLLCDAHHAARTALCACPARWLRFSGTDRRQTAHRARHPSDVCSTTAPPPSACPSSYRLLLAGSSMHLSAVPSTRHCSLPASPKSCGFRTRGSIRATGARLLAPTIAPW